jgi:hypothetical protein
LWGKADPGKRVPWVNKTGIEESGKDEKSIEDI